jgi:hypothetical protein
LEIACIPNLYLVTLKFAEKVSFKRPARAPALLGPFLFVLLAHGVEEQI